MSSTKEYSWGQEVWKEWNRKDTEEATGSALLLAQTSPWEA